jgi:hypothetical protein
MKALLVGVCVALVATAAASAAPPHPVIGTWTRTVSAQDISRAHAKKVKAGSKWTLVITERKTTVSSPGAKTYSGTIIPSSATQASFEIGPKEANLYSWRLTGKTLTLRKYSDPSAERAAILDGAWKRS